MKRRTRHAGLTCLTILATLASLLQLPAAETEFDIIIRHGKIVDGTGNPWFFGDIAIKADRIASIGTVAGAAKREIDARGLVVAPGFIDTDMTRALNDEQRTALTAQVPMARLGSVDDIAAAVLFLCSPGASYITGETLHVNGGMYMA